MPYLKKVDKERLVKNPGAATTPGDWNYLYTTAMIKTWCQKQSYTTIHNLKKSTRNAGLVEDVMEVESLLVAVGVTSEDRMAARELAFMEFYRRVAKFYENQKAADNGDVYEGVPHSLDHFAVAEPTIGFDARVAEASAIKIPLTDFRDDMEIGAGIEEEESNGNDNRTKRKGKSR